MMESDDEIERGGAEYVYFMGKPDGSAPIKIGKTKYLSNRLSTVRVHCPFPVDCHGYVETENSSTLERAIHFHFKDKRIHREWFDISAEEAKIVFESLAVLARPAEDFLPKRKDKIGRPPTDYVKIEYNRAYMADKRRAVKLGITVKELRALEA